MKSKFNVTGMTCSACSAHVEKAVRKLDGVTEVSVNLMSASMIVEHSITDKDIIEAVTKAGYGCTVKGENAPTTSATEKKQQESKQMRLRLSLSIGFLAILMYVSMGHMISLPLPS